MLTLVSPSRPSAAGQAAWISAVCSAEGCALCSALSNTLKACILCSCRRVLAGLSIQRFQLLQCPAGRDVPVGQPRLLPGCAAAAACCCWTGPLSHLRPRQVCQRLHAVQGLATPSRHTFRHPGLQGSNPQPWTGSWARWGRPDRCVIPAAGRGQRSWAALVGHLAARQQLCVRHQVCCQRGGRPAGRHWGSARRDQLVPCCAAQLSTACSGRWPALACECSGPSCSWPARALRPTRWTGPPRLAAGDPQLQSSPEAVPAGLASQQAL